MTSIVDRWVKEYNVRQIWVRIGDALIRSHWEPQAIADADQRPPRKYYKLTATGRNTLEASRKRYPLLAKLIPSPQEEQV